MDFGKLDQNEKLAIYGSVVALLAGLISNFGGPLYLSLFAAIVMVVVILLPHFSPSTDLPGSKGTLMATLGVVAAAGALITAARWFSVIGAVLGSISTIMFLVALAGALVMAWAGWQELQAEGGRWRFNVSRPRGGSSPATGAPEPALAPAVESTQPPVAEEDRPSEA